MKIFKKVLRLLLLILLIALACAGIGLPFINYRENYLDNEIRIELVDKRKSEQDLQVKDEAEKKN